MAETQIRSDVAAATRADRKENIALPITAITWTGLVFAALQSVCTAVIAVSGVRLVIGLGSLALAAGVTTSLNRFHADRIRIPMMILALLGAMLNLFVLWHARRLRNRPAAQWRRKPLEPKQMRSERWQIGLSVLTLVLLIAEESIHFVLHRVG